MSKVDFLLELPIDISSASLHPARYQPLESLLIAAEMHKDSSQQLMDGAQHNAAASCSQRSSSCMLQASPVPPGLASMSGVQYKQEILPTLEHLVRSSNLMMMLDPSRSSGNASALPSLPLLSRDRSLLDLHAYPHASPVLSETPAASVVRPLAQLATCSVVLSNSLELAQQRALLQQLLSQTLSMNAAANSMLKERKDQKQGSLLEKRRASEEEGIDYAQCLKKSRVEQESCMHSLQQALRKELGAASSQPALLKAEHRFVSRKRLGIVHDRRGRLREVEDLFLDCPLMRPYIEMGYSAQSVLAAFADARGPLLMAIKEVATACQGCASSWGTKEAQGNILASIEARKIRQTDTWMSIELDAESGKRKEIIFGSRLAELLGVTTEELMCSEIDFICYLVDDMAITTHLLVHSRGSNWMKPVKDSEESGNTLEKMLSITHIREHDTLGRLVRLTTFYTHATEDQYNAAISRSLPPLTLHLREQAGFKNLLWRQKIAMQCVGRILHIKKSPEGRAKLLALSQSITERLNTLKESRSC
ncbi:hypothetical protein GUITHDRAFT_119822 [Guillardia theta CCMP2712]|uniref:Uncharacterized protein n=1 Tax=Guillardia theta (strain CCMP2712) TaxID=905079 RepID=L1ID48_GUITC|nr:hypothetical protein GUITHDRAFT_119822 [Guillardia theta CCMP2712]EKX34022.1 hypothetical protein GUITHDRAFT_119822 [Guillardia theta CCMP2712]|eukprot:XP_005821002.1 hypothetical protein GUITHDRAFT_119822 [Guillardia theta CCMP2712]